MGMTFMVTKCLLTVFGIRMMPAAVILLIAGVNECIATWVKSRLNFDTMSQHMYTHLSLPVIADLWVVAKLLSVRKCECVRARERVHTCMRACLRVLVSVCMCGHVHSCVTALRLQWAACVRA